MTGVTQAKLRNHILSQLPPAEFQNIAPHLQRVDLKPRTVLISSGDRIGSVYFIESGLVSVLGVLESGARVEISHVGRDGLVGVQVALGAESAQFEVMSHMQGEAFKLATAAFVQLMSQNGALREAVLRYAWRAHVQIAQTAICNAAHEVEPRLARWLLLAHDRVDGDRLPLTQEVLSMMLGASRPAVTVASGALQRAGLIKTQRGAICVLDRAGLESAACECYRVTHFPRKTR